MPTPRPSFWGRDVSTPLNMTLLLVAEDGSHYFPNRSSGFPLADSMNLKQLGPVLGVRLPGLEALRLGWPPLPVRLRLEPAYAAASKRPRCRAARSGESAAARA